MRSVSDALDVLPVEALVEGDETPAAAGDVLLETLAEAAGGDPAVTLGASDFLPNPGIFNPQPAANNRVTNKTAGNTTVFLWVWRTRCAPWGALKGLIKFRFFTLRSQQNLGFQGFREGVRGASKVSSKPPSGRGVQRTAWLGKRLNPVEATPFCDFSMRTTKSGWGSISIK